VTKIHAALTAALFLTAATAFAGDGTFIDPHTETAWLPGTAGTTAGAAGAFVMPAAWALNDRTSTAFWWDDRDQTGSSLENWGLSVGHTFGLAIQHRNYLLADGPASVTDWQMGLAFGDNRHASALAWRFTSGDKTAVGREKALVLNTIHRPGKSLSVGLNGTFSVESGAREGVMDVGFRPFGASWLTLFGDYVLRNGEDWDGGRWGAGVSVQPIRGLHLGVKLRDVPGLDDLQPTFAAGVTVGGSGYHALPSYDPDGEHLFTSYLLEQDGPRAPLPFDPPVLVSPPARYVALDLQNRRLTYQKFRWFDDVRVAWMDLARMLRAVGDDDDVDGLVLNLAGFSGRPSLIWEFGRELEAFSAAGKEVVVHIDRAGMLQMMLAASADIVTMDPEGEIILPGIDLSRTYLKGLLDQLGLGFRALQYFDSKTAVEVLSREDMSESDRAQRGRIADVIYEQVRDAVTSGRDLDAVAFDGIVDDKVMIFAGEAMGLGLVDRTERWHDLPEWLSENRHAVMTGLDEQRFRQHADQRWGLPPSIAVVYAVGECAMDSGIRGRATSAYLRSLVDDSDVVAVVLRADSPGGDPLPSDLVAEAITMLRDAGKPVVISQGDVAASGGYWISMGGTEILTTPLTITGSIGVISGWLWDDKMHGKVGVNADGVSRGRHADLFRNVRYPLGFDVPTRDMTDEEADFAKDRILDLYERFLGFVAEGRGLEVDAVTEVAAGRVWMGGDAIELGLCDRIGGLMDAVERASDLAGLTEKPRLLEYPPRPLMKMPEFGLPIPGLSLRLALPLLTGPEAATEAGIDPGSDLVRALASWNGRPTVLLLPDMLPEAWRNAE